MTPLRGTYFMDRNAYIAHGEPMIFHCNHYNAVLQYVIEAVEHTVDVQTILTDASRDVVFDQLQKHFRENETKNAQEQARSIEDLFRFSGFGQLRLSEAIADGLQDSQSVRVAHDHYGVAWKGKYGQRAKEKPGASFFVTGFLAACFDLISDSPKGTYSAEQTACIAKGDEHAEFQLTKQATPGAVRESVGQGEFTTFEFENPQGTEVDYVAIRSALTNMPIEGDERGLIDAFDVLLTRHYANYYCEITTRTVDALTKAMGEAGAQMARDMLFVEAGHVCAFNTFGGVMLSAEWNGLIKPMLSGKSDWVHGIVACVNAFGWGKYSVKELIPGEKLVIRIDSGYESNHYLGKYGANAQAPISYLATGATAGIMNLLFNGDVTTNPTLDDAYYKQITGAKDKFVAKQTKCRAKGDAYDEFVATRSNL